MSKKKKKHKDNDNELPSNDDTGLNKDDKNIIVDIDEPDHSDNVLQGDNQEELTDPANNIGNEKDNSNLKIGENKKNFNKGSFLLIPGFIIIIIAIFLFFTLKNPSGVPTSLIKNIEEISNNLEILQNNQKKTDKMITSLKGRFEAEINDNKNLISKVDKNLKKLKMETGSNNSRVMQLVSHVKSLGGKIQGMVEKNISHTVGTASRNEDDENLDHIADEDSVHDNGIDTSNMDEEIIIGNHNSEEQEIDENHSDERSYDEGVENFLKIVEGVSVFIKKEIKLFLNWVKSSITR